MGYVRCFCGISFGVFVVKISQGVRRDGMGIVFGVLDFLPNFEDRYCRDFDRAFGGVG